MDVPGALTVVVLPHRLHRLVYLSLGAELHVLHPLTVALKLGQRLALHPLVELHGLLQRLDPLLQVHLIADLTLVLRRTNRNQSFKRGPQIMLLSVVKEILKTKIFSCHVNDVELLIIGVYSDPLSLCRFLFFHSVDSERDVKLPV